MRRARRWLDRSTLRLTVTAGVAGLVIAASATLARGRLTVPWVPDEFSYLLAADTYAHGRLTNPTPAMPEHFRSEGVLVTPTYASKYPPAQGLLLALGQVLTGQPIVGVWLSYGLLCAAFTWMLLAWTRPAWALWGGALASLWLVGHYSQSASFDSAYWATTYWGGKPSAIGAALVLGGLRRIIARPRVSAALAMATGLAIMANSRPAEGLFLAIVPCGVLGMWLVLDRTTRPGERVRRVVLPMVAVLAATAGGMAWLNYRVTGNPWRLPYLEYESQQPRGEFQPFLGRGQRRVDTSGDASLVRRAIASIAWEFQRHPTKPGFGLAAIRNFYLPKYLYILALGVPWVLRRRWAWVALASAGMVGVAVILETFRISHYAAPAAPALVILFALSARQLAVWRVARARVGGWLVVLCFAGAVASALASARDAIADRGRQRTLWPARRAAMVHRLETDGRRHIILVSYGPRHPRVFEWVYNPADIMAARVIWAHSRGEASDRALLAAYGGRAAWRLHVNRNDGPFDLVPIAP